MAQAIDWWERAAEEVISHGVDPAQAIRLLCKAEQAADAISAHMRQRSLADSAMAILPGSEKRLLWQQPGFPHGSPRYT